MHCLSTMKYLNSPEGLKSREKKQSPIMDNFTAIGVAEGFMEAESEKQWLEAWQHLVDTGLAWQLQGWFGRSAQHLIDEGRINNA